MSLDFQEHYLFNSIMTCPANSAATIRSATVEKLLRSVHCT